MAASRRGPLAFAARATAFWAPLALVLGGFEATLWWTGESRPVAAVLDAQQRDPDALFLRGLLDQSLYAYKSEGLARARPRVLALGSSRVMKLRAGMFGDDAARFYNAGGLVVNLDDLLHLARGLPQRGGPEVVLLAVDMWWLNGAKRSETRLAEGRDGALDWRGHVHALRGLLRRPGDRERLLAALAPAEATAGGLGVEARRRGQGFRLDGSLAGGLPVPESEAEWAFVDRERPPIARQIRRGAGFFPGAGGVSPQRLDQLERALTELRERGALVVGFAPPVYSQAAELLDREPAQRGLWSDYRELLPRLFEHLGLPFFDASTPAALGLDDRYMTDGFHAEETFHLHLLLRMLEDPRVAGALPTARSAVRRALVSPATNPWYADLSPQASRAASLD